METKTSRSLSGRMKCILFVASCMIALNTVNANNLTIKTGSVSGSSVIFTISWDNSWKNKTTDNPNNYDAVWVFIKYHDCNTPNFGWNHAKLSPTSADHKVGGTELTVDAVADSNGVFIRRNAVDTGNIAAVQCTLKLVAPATAGTYSFRVFGVEMVNIPQGDFNVGDGISANTFSSITINSNDTILASKLGGGSTTVPASFPKGWTAFYCMKYEITQEQYTDFLNTLTYDQQTTRTSAVPNSVVGTKVVGGNSRNDIKISVIGSVNPSKFPAVYATGVPNVACNYLSLADLEAYLDWACLRPMTDLEFEKICRGPLARIDREYVWGVNSQLTAATQAWSGYPTNQLNNPGTATETSKSAGNGLAAYGHNWCAGGCNEGPLRVGFSATGTTDRVKSASSYYGVLDMGGNIWERIVAVNANGVKYTGTLGDGVLDASGNMNVSNWPAANAIGYRGGSWYDAAQYMQTSDRTYWNSGDTGRGTTSGGRGVR